MNTSIPSLHCLEGKSPPNENIRGDLLAVLELSETAKAAFWELLSPCLQEVLSEEVDEWLRSFGTRHHSSPALLMKAVKVVRFLFREASRRDLPQTYLALDIESLAGDQAAQVYDILGPIYERAKEQIRREMVLCSLTDHGKLLTAVDWRVDNVAASHRGFQLNTPIVMLTFHFQEGNRKERMTVQAMPEVLRHLQQVCSKILAK
jgi:hypothetical protein